MNDREIDCIENALQEIDRLKDIVKNVRVMLDISMKYIEEAEYILNHKMKKASVEDR